MRAWRKRERRASSSERGSKDWSTGSEIGSEGLHDMYIYNDLIKETCFPNRLCDPLPDRSVKEDTKHKYTRTAAAQPATKAANRDSPPW